MPSPGCSPTTRRCARIGAPTVNSYKRLVPGLIAGYWANWGLDNRFSTYRVPGERGQATRIECRNPDGACSPHLVTAALLTAMLHGVEEELPLPEPQVGDADAEPNTDRHAPHSLAEALDAIEKDTVLTEAIGTDLVRTFVGVKRTEVARFNAAVTDWEIREYCAPVLTSDRAADHVHGAGGAITERARGTHGTS